MSDVSKSYTRFTTLALLIAIELLLGYTPLGFIPLPFASITTMHIPVIITSIILGPLYGSTLGLTFGLISLFKAISNPGLSFLSGLLSPFTSGAPIYSIIICLAPRILLGIIPFYTYKALSKFIKNRPIPMAISAGFSTICHTIMVLGGVSCFFNRLPLKEAFLAIISINGSCEILAAVIIVPAVSIPVRKFLVTRNTLTVS